MAESSHTTTPRSGIRKGLLFVGIVAVLAGVVYVISIFFFHAPAPSLPGLPQNLSSEKLTVAIPEVPKTLDAADLTDPSSQRLLLGNVYEGLTRRDNDNKPAPGLATSWDVSDDALTYTFHLNSSLRFSDGTALTAHSIVTSLQETVENTYPGYKQLGALDTVTATNDATVTITLDSPNPDLLWTLAGRAGMVTLPDSSGTAGLPLGSGPLTLAAFTPGASATFERNTNYWGTPSQAAGVTMTAYSDPAAAAEDLAAGTIQGAVGLTSAQGDAAQKAGMSVTAGESSTRVTLIYNSDATSLMSDKRMRESLQISLDKSAIIGAVDGLGTPVGGPIPPLDPGYEDLTGAFPLDPAKGASLRTYFYFSSLSLVYQDGVDERVVQSLVDTYAAQGITLLPAKLTAEQWKQQVEAEHKFDLALTQQTEGHDFGFWTSGSNWWTYDSPDADEQYTQARAATTDEDYEKGLAQAARTLVSGIPADWLYSKKIISAWAPSISGAPTNMLDCSMPLAGIAPKA